MPPLMLADVGAAGDDLLMRPDFTKEDAAAAGLGVVDFRDFDTMSLKIDYMHNKLS